jgi:26S proteasome regulatory subunit N1
VDALIGNSTLSSLFAALAVDLDVLEPKSPEDIYKSHLSGAADRRGEAAVESAKQNLAATYVNAFVNAGYGTGMWLFSHYVLWRLAQC